MRTADQVIEYTACQGDILITEAEMLQALSALVGKEVEAFTDEPAIGGWWLTLKPASASAGTGKRSGS